MKSLILLLSSFSVIAFAQEIPGKNLPDGFSQPFELNNATGKILKPKGDYTEYKMLVKKVENPGQYKLLIAQPSKSPIPIPNLLPISENQNKSVQKKDED